VSLLIVRGYFLVDNMFNCVDVGFQTDNDFPIMLSIILPTVSNKNKKHKFDTAFIYLFCLFEPLTW